MAWMNFILGIDALNWINHENIRCVEKMTGVKCTEMCSYYDFHVNTLSVH